jgi:SAM-dependent methyltransferase
MTCVRCGGHGGAPVLEVHADYGRLHALLGAQPARAPRLADAYVRCVGCGLVHLAQRLEDDLWHAFTFAEADPAKHAHDAPRLAAVAAHDVALVRRHAATGRWLEIGCGYGHTLAAARALAIDAHGVDLAPRKLAYARERLGVPADALHLGDPMGLEFEAGAWQAVLMVHVLEHLPNPVGVLRRVAEWLAPGGVVLIATPNLRSWKARWAGAAWGYATPFGHLALYEWATLTGLLADAGLRVRARVPRVALGGPLRRAATRVLARCAPDALSEICVLAARAE